MRKLVWGLLVILLLVGCTPSVVGDASLQRPNPPTGNWIGPGKIYITGMGPGSNADEWTVDLPEFNFKAGDPLGFLLHNGNKGLASFMLYFKEPSYTEAGYVKATPELLEYVRIDSPMDIQLLGDEVRQIRFSVGIPKEASVPDKWEFWVAAVDRSQTGTVRTELATRVLVSG